MTAAKTPTRPTKIKVGYITFDVIYLDDEAWAANPELSDGDAGQTNGSRAEIHVRLATGQHEIHMKEVLLHEVLHACFYASGITIEGTLRVQDDIEEYTVARVSPVLLQTLRDNPQLSKYLES